MRLILDFGNTFQKCAIFNKTELVVFERFRNIQLEDIKAFIEPYSQVKSAILVSVINQKEDILSWLNDSFFFIKMDHDTPVPIKNLYGSPQTLGLDRLSAAVGAASLYPNQDTLSIDTGTAIKFDFVNSKGEYLGGSISPGANLRFKALHTFTDKLPLVPYKKEHPLLGNSTQQSILSGVINGTIAEINGMIEMYESQYKGLKIILTGGESFYFVKSIKSNIFADSNLVIKGLNEILKFNEEL